VPKAEWYLCPSHVGPVDLFFLQANQKPTLRVAFPQAEVAPLSQTAQITVEICRGRCLVISDADVTV
jgi:hypothetical protein